MRPRGRVAVLPADVDAGVHRARPVRRQPEVLADLVGRRVAEHVHRRAAVERPADAGLDRAGVSGRRGRGGAANPRSCTVTTTGACAGRRRRSSWRGRRRPGRSSARSRAGRRARHNRCVEPGRASATSRRRRRGQEPGERARPAPGHRVARDARRRRAGREPGESCAVAWPTPERSPMSGRGVDGDAQRRRGIGHARRDYVRSYRRAPVPGPGRREAGWYRRAGSYGLHRVRSSRRA